MRIAYRVLRIYGGVEKVEDVGVILGSGVVSGEGGLVGGLGGFGGGQVAGEEEAGEG